MYLGRRGRYSREAPAACMRVPTQKDVKILRKRANLRDCNFLTLTYKNWYHKFCSLLSRTAACLHWQHHCQQQLLALAQIERKLKHKNKRKPTSTDCNINHPFHVTVGNFLKSVRQKYNLNFLLIFNLKCWMV